MDSVDGILKQVIGLAIVWTPILLVGWTYLSRHVREKKRSAELEEQARKIAAFYYPVPPKSSSISDGSRHLLDQLKGNFRLESAKRGLFETRGWIRFFTAFIHFFALLELFSRARPRVSKIICQPHGDLLFVTADLDVSGFTGVYKTSIHSILAPRDRWPEFIMVADGKWKSMDRILYAVDGSNFVMETAEPDTIRKFFAREGLLKSLFGKVCAVEGQKRALFFIAPNEKRLPTGHVPETMKFLRETSRLLDQKENIPPFKLEATKSKRRYF